MNIMYEFEKPKFKFLTFKKLNIWFYLEKVKKLYDEIIFSSSDIIYYINKYKMTHLIYTE